MKPFLPSSGSPRRCEDCDGPVLVPEKGPIIDDSHVHRGERHDGLTGVCPAKTPKKPLPGKVSRAKPARRRA